MQNIHCVACPEKGPDLSPCNILNGKYTVLSKNYTQDKNKLQRHVILWVWRETLCLKYWFVSIFSSLGISFLYFEPQRHRFRKDSQHNNEFKQKCQTKPRSSPSNGIDQVNSELTEREKDKELKLVQLSHTLTFLPAVWKRPPSDPTTQYTLLHFTAFYSPYSVWLDFSILHSTLVCFNLLNNKYDVSHQLSYFI